MTTLTLDLKTVVPSPTTDGSASGGPADVAPEPATRRSRRGMIAVAFTGVVATSVLTWAAWIAHDNNENRLLEQRAREAAATLTNGLPAVQTPLVSAAELAQATGGDLDTFRRYVSPQVGESARFEDAAALWSADPSATEPLVVIGDSLALPSVPGDRAGAALARALETPSLTIVSLLDLDEPRVGYMYRSPLSPDYIAYAESILPANRTQQVRDGQAFSGLDFAVYLGDTEVDSALVIASTEDLPLSGRRASEPVPFGDAQFHLVMSPTTSLGGPLMAALPWIIAAVGLALTAAGAAATNRLMTRQAQTESLSRQNAVLADQQRGIAQTLQRSLLPDRLPVLDGIEVAARHEAGAQGAEIGGDWYEVVAVDADRLLLIVGDVSGRGLPAAATMASLRFSARAYAFEGHEPSEILTRLSRLLDVSRDGHFATVLCATIDTRTGEIRLASAGHPNPVIVDDRGVRLADLRPGVPVGLGPGAVYDTVTERPGSSGMILAFTDGLFERRGEAVDVGLERVRHLVERHRAAPLEQLLDTLTDELLDGSEDDTAIVGVRWLSTTK